MSSQPGLDGRGLTIRQQRDDLAPFQIADAGVSVIASPGAIDAYTLSGSADRRLWCRGHAQDRVFAHGGISRFAKPAAG
ncbi:hypothetical protein GGD63_005832 [Bradyrhizobium sp. cir1]|uniref:hypothetical protein n=1 Tax=Bradyrhizobium sp. cir1 TaxID=1445730 RepID=UPI0017BD87FD|nr:hypothetical protein [Bradyrhizobium sp. cir1]MBB4373017.1 hypothetical protein [Bradyrhizobium sp. cir1]